jgi:hypothetical protein
VLDFPRDTTLHSRLFPRCGLARLEAKGPSGCPPRARVGSGVIVAMSPLEPKRVDATVTAFNGVSPNGRFRRALLVHVRPEVGPQFVLVAAWKGNARNLRLDLAWPPPIEILAGVPPDPAPTRISLSLDAKRGTATYIAARCRGEHQATGHYADGSVVTSTARSSCN